MKLAKRISVWIKSQKTGFFLTKFFMLNLTFYTNSDKHSILLHRDLNPAWHFWLSTRFSCCLKMKSVENNFKDFQEARENIWNCSRKYTKVLQTDSFLGNKKNLNQCLAWSLIMPLCNRIFCCIFGWYFYVKSGWNMKKIFCCPALELFHWLPLWTTVRLHGKKLQNATNMITSFLRVHYYFYEPETSNKKSW